MALNTFGVTPENLRSDFLPSTSPFSAASRPTAADVGRQIDRIAAGVGAVLASVGVSPEAVTEQAHPIAHAWLADLLALGAIVRVARISTLGLNPEAVQEWAKEFEAGLEKLRKNPEACIPDALEAVAGGDAADVRTHTTSEPAREPEFTRDIEG